MASRPAPAPKRPSQLPAFKPPCNIYPSAIIADKAQITGSHAVEIGENAVIHPWAKIRAEGGKVVIGQNSMVYEGATVGTVDGGDVLIGDYVNIETGAVVEARSVGDGTTVEVNAVVGKGAVLGKWCTVAPLERVEAGEELEDFTVVYGDGQRRVDKTTKEHAEVRELKKGGQEKAVQATRALVPNAMAKWAG
ncbi:hypothetical protein B0A54_10632 [Friedmanniomyces endolithicus]|uniref:Dynactin subunit 6 n=1 Tax=Friedmanniomyces endolithicus TaxID=329885 RepID=A0A4U0UQU3_9PEZI|nr:hypothetical protein B0A54_10632 [Friedmanniomyces endolithicus]